MSDNEVMERIVATYQTYESSSGRSEYRTALVWQQPPDGEVQGLEDPYLVLTVEADSSAGTKGEFSGHPTESAAREAAQAWLGSDRQVAPEKVSYGAYNWLVTAVTGYSWR